MFNLPQIRFALLLSPIVRSKNSITPTFLSASDHSQAFYEFIFEYFATTLISTKHFIKNKLITKFPIVFPSFSSFDSYLQIYFFCQFVFRVMCCEVSVMKIRFFLVNHDFKVCNWDSLLSV